MLDDALRSLDLEPDFGGLNRFYECSTVPLPSEYIVGDGINSICRNAFVLVRNQMIQLALRAVLDALTVYYLCFFFLSF